MSGKPGNDAVVRVSTGVVGIAVIVGLVYAGGVLFQGAVFLVAGIMLYEYRRLVAAGGTGPSREVLVGAGLATVALVGAGRLEVVPGLLLAAVTAEAALGLRAFPGGGLLRRVGAVAFGVVYLGVPLGLWLVLRRTSLWLLASGFVLIWANDVMAYATGVNFGRRRLAPEISPKKSVEGALGGLVASGVAGAFVRQWLGLPLGESILVGLAVGVAGQLGDLVESALKREAGLKDSGRILPGHGGFLDRFDSSLVGFPVLYFLVRFLG